MSHDYLGQALADLEAMPVIEHGEATGRLVLTVHFVIQTIEARRDAEWVRSLRSDFIMLLAMVVDGTRPATVATMRQHVINGLKHAVKDKVL